MRSPHLAPALLLAAATLAACADRPTGPAGLDDPAATAADLAALDGALQAPVVRSYTLFAGVMPTAGGALAGATASLLPEPGESPYALRARRALALERAATTLDGAGAAITLIPEELRGSVFRWDSASSAYYRAAATGGPPNGIRVILYAVDDAGRIAYPLVEVGRADLMDESTETSARLHIVAQSADGTVTFVDHLVAVTPAPAGFTAFTQGRISNGLAGADNRTLRFGASISASATETSLTAALDAALSLDNPAVNVRLAERHAFTHEGGAVSTSFAFSQPGETVQLDGLFTVTRVTAESALVTINATIRADGQLVAIVQGTPLDGLTFRDGDGNPLPPGPVLEALGQLSRAAEGVSRFAHGLFSPLGNVFGAF